MYVRTYIAISDTIIICMHIRTYIRTYTVPTYIHTYIRTYVYISGKLNEKVRSKSHLPLIPYSAIMRQGKILVNLVNILPFANILPPNAFLTT